MAPIEIQTSKPLKTSAADDASQAPSSQATVTKLGQTHSTQAPIPSQAGSYVPASTTSVSPPFLASPRDAAATSTSAAPGARPPGPTAAPFTAVTQSSLLPPTRTTAVEAARSLRDPPMPQPGAAPVPPTSMSTGSRLPPPPRPGQAPYQPPYAPVARGSSESHGTQRDTETSLSHPPGYQQNSSIVAEHTLTHSSETSTGRKQEGLPLGGNASERGSMLGDSAKMQDQAGEAWTAVKGWAGAAGSKLAAVEKDVWNWVDKKN